MLLAVRPDDLGESLLFGLGCWIEGTCIIACCLCESDAARCRTCEFLLDLDPNIPCIIRPNRRGDDGEHIVLTWTGRNEMRRTEQEWTYVKRHPFIIRNPGRIQSDEFFQSIHEHVFRNLGHIQSNGRAIQALKILFRTKDRHRTVELPVCLKAFKCRLTIVQCVQ